MKKCKIVVVDHDALLLETMVECLVAQGYEAVEATTYENAFQTLDSVPPFSVLIAQVNSIDGRNFIHTVRQTYPALPILLISSWSKIDLMVLSGSWLYLQTPFDLRQLLTAVSACIATSPSWDESRIQAVAFANLDTAGLQAKFD